ncbi:hypothetical protein IBTHAUMO2_960002 [Nitrosopumilaceae archaeon]|nr:hypothetical protein [Nitrosopumilus sp.]MDA7997133.1 hypothetical protein [Nitrosopumilus sp.]CAI9832732.1 hypothetical protein IBTHAUMO2_960002 [Nitrosopumilaceae archaeon]
MPDTHTSSAMTGCKTYGKTVTWFVWMRYSHGSWEQATRVIFERLANSGTTIMTRNRDQFESMRAHALAFSTPSLE